MELIRIVLKETRHNEYEINTIADDDVVYRKNVQFPLYERFTFSTEKMGVKSGITDTMGIIRLGTIFGSRFSDNKGVTFSFGNIIGSRGMGSHNLEYPEFSIKYLGDGKVGGNVTFEKDDSVAVIAVFDTADSDENAIVLHNVNQPEFVFPFPFDNGAYSFRCRTIKRGGLQTYYSPSVKIDISGEDLLPDLMRLEKVAVIDPINGRAVETLARNKLYELHVKCSEIREMFAMLWFHHKEFSGGNYDNRGGLFNRKYNYTFNFSSGTEPIFYAAVESDKHRSLRADGIEYLYIEDSDNFFKIDTVSKTMRVRFRLLNEASPGIWLMSGFLERDKNQRSPLFVAKYKVLSTAEESMLEKEEDKKKRMHGVFFGILIVSMSTIFIYALVYYKKRSRGNEQGSEKTIARVRLIDNDHNIKDENHPQKHLVIKAQKYIHENYHNQISLSDVANALSCSEAWAARIFRQVVGMTVVQYITKIRMEKACELLSETSLRITDIAMKTGYSGMVHFGRMFKEETGMTPKEYRKQKGAMLPR